MNCPHSKERLALFVEGDLPDSLAKKVENHLEECTLCRQFCEDLDRSQALLKSLRQDTIAHSTFVGIRSSVLSRIGDGQETLGWAVKIERFILLGFRKPRYAISGVVIAAIVSVTLLGQMRRPDQAAGEAGRHPASSVTATAVFDGAQSMRRPEGYRDWISVSTRPLHNVYINPVAYRDYVKTGEFPQGTVMVLEMTNSASTPESTQVEASVKDNRFAGGWGYFGFTDGEGKLKAKAEPESSGCRSCHEQQAATDHVFTQFYPALRLARS